MSREFGKVKSTIWMSQKFNALDSDLARLIYIYFLTTQHGNSLGCYRIHIGYIMADLDRSEADILQAITACQKSGLLQYDTLSKYVFIADFLEHSAPTNQSHAKRVCNDTLSIGNEKYKYLVMQDLLRVSKGKPWKVTKEFQEEFDTLSTPCRQHGTTETETETETETIEPKGSVHGQAEHAPKEEIAPPEKPKNTSPRSATFNSPDGRFYSFKQTVDILWKEYPRIRVNRGKAQFEQQVERYLKQNGKDVPEWNAAILNLAAKIREYATYINETGELQPDPHRWMANKGYEDDYTDAPRQIQAQPQKGSNNAQKRDDIAEQAATLLDKLGQG